MKTLSCIEINPDTPANASIIWLHGLGANGHDFEPVVPELKLPEHLAVRFIFPNAPEIPVTINGGYIMPAWYDILEMNIERKVDESQLKASASAIQALIEQEIARGIPSERIVIAGFSQGGAVAYEAALSYPKPLAGIMGLSTYFATADSIERNQANANTPIAVFHGSHDPVVPELLGRKAHRHFKELGYTCEFQSYPIEHHLCLEEIHDIADWLGRVLAA